MNWQNLAATKEFFHALHAEFRSCLKDGWYETTDSMVIQRMRGQRDVFVAIERLLGSVRSSDDRE
jgi:hypothetical protein